jgi:hypothetical protein
LLIEGALVSVALGWGITAAFIVAAFIAARPYAVEWRWVLELLLLEPTLGNDADTILIRPATRPKPYSTPD